MPQVPYELTQGLNVVNPGIREGVDVKTYPNLQAEQMVESGRQLVHSGTNLKIMMDQVMLDRAETNAKGHDSIIADELRVRMHDSKNGFLTLSGQRAVDESDAAKAGAAKYVKDYVAANVKDPFEASIVSRVAGARLQHAYQTIDSHTITQNKVYKESVFVAGMNGYNQDLAAAIFAHHNNPLTSGKASNQVAELLGARNAALKQHFADFGADENSPIYKNALMQADTKLAQDVIGNWVTQGKVKEARAYLAVNAKQIDQTAMNQMTQLVDIAALSKESIELANTLPGGFAEKRLGLESMLKKETISDNKYNATLQQINRNEYEDKQRTSESHANIKNKVLQMLDANPGWTTSNLPPSLQQAMNGVPGLPKEMNKYIMAGGQFNTDPDVYLTLMGTDPKELAKISDSDFYNNYSSKLSPGDYDAIYTRRSLGSGAGAKGGRALVSIQDQVTRELRRNGVLPAEKGQGNAKQQQYAYSVTLEIQKRVAAEAARIGAKDGLDPDKTQKIIDDVLLERITVPGRIFGTNTISPYSGSMEQQRVINQMIAQDVPLTPENIQKAMSQAGVR